MKKMLQMVRNAQQSLLSRAKDEKGATMVEYALMVALIAVVCIAAVSAIGTEASTKFNAVATNIQQGK